jgi:hypothetical protein
VPTRHPINYLGVIVSDKALHEALASVRRRLLTRADTTPALHRDEDRDHVKKLALAALEWLAGGERDLPAPLAALPERDRVRVLAEAHQLGEVIRARVAHLAARRCGRTGGGR